MVIVRNYDIRYNGRFFENLVILFQGTCYEDILIKACKATNKYLVSAMIAEKFKDFIENEDRQLNIRYIANYIEKHLLDDLKIEEAK